MSKNAAVNIIRKPGRKPIARARFWVGGKRQEKKRTFPLGTPDTVLVRWIAEYEARFAPVRANDGSFADDVAHYLAEPKIAAMPSLGERRYYLTVWLDVLGRDRSRASITRDEIEVVIQSWLKHYAPATVYHRRTALSHLYSTLDGPGVPNVVRQTTRPEPWSKRPQAIAYPVLAQILDTMADERHVTRGETRPSVAKTVARVLLHTGLMGADLRRVTRDDFDARAGVVRVPGRQKGRGSDAWLLPLDADGLAAFVAFDALNLYGGFSPAAVSASFKRAARRVLGYDTQVHLYSLRHSVGGDGAASGAELAAVGRGLGHAPGSIATAQYAASANLIVDRRVVAARSAYRQEQLATARANPVAVGHAVGHTSRNSRKRAS